MLNSWLGARDCYNFSGMNDPQLAAALRTSSPGALADLFDAYGDRLFRYCWCMLRNRENAQIVVRDTLVVAAAHIDRLASGKLLGPWLYSLARAECRRREAVPASDADEPPARPDQLDADSRLMAWNAAMSIQPGELEALELAFRHDMDLSLVLGLPPADAEELLDRAKQNLERSLGAEVLIRRNYDCPARAEVMSGWTGMMTAAIRDRVLEHAGACPDCGPNLPRNVSAARVFTLLPAPAFSTVARLEVLKFIADPRLSAYREFVVGRASEFNASGFPVMPAPPRPRPRSRPRRTSTCSRSRPSLCGAGPASRHRGDPGGAGARRAARGGACGA